MLTIKIILPDGTETIHEANTVRFHPGVYDGKNGTYVSYWDKDGVSHNVYGPHKAYIMNDMGKTISMHVVNDVPVSAAGTETIVSADWGEG